ncbi:recombinase family protein [Paraburkholderia phytofirmans]
MYGFIDAFEGEVQERSALSTFPVAHLSTCAIINPGPGPLYCESQLQQYGLADRTRAFGWPDVTVIDDDLGRSGSGTHRPGFERLLVALCGGKVGAVFCIETSRLARNGRDCHTLLEFCRVVG